MPTWTWIERGSAVVEALVDRGATVEGAFACVQRTKRGFADPEEPGAYPKTLSTCKDGCWYEMRLTIMGNRFFGTFTLARPASSISRSYAMP
jgi:hypothetical protein